jgi:hypothetical protein
MLREIARQLRVHAPFTAFGAATGIVVVVLLVHFDVSSDKCTVLFWAFHPIHVLLSALVTTGMYRLHGKGGLWQTFLIGYFGSVGIATLSDCLIPFIGETLLNLPNKGIHFGVFEKWWLVNPLALGGIVIACLRPQTKFPHAGHVLLSTWASLFHMAMAGGMHMDTVMLMSIGAFLFLAVWIPCCTSDIVFPLLFAAHGARSRGAAEPGVGNG